MTRHDPGRPVPDAVHAAVTVGLAALIVGLVLSVAANSGSGASPLVRTIKERLFAPWLAPAWLDLGFEHPLTYGLPEDGDHMLEIRRRKEAGVAATALVFPGPFRGERAARWRRLARAVATATAQENDDGPRLAAALGAGSFGRLGVDDVTVRILRWPVPERNVVPPAAPVEISTARVRRVGDDLQLIKEEPAGEVAPLLRPDRGRP